MESLVGYTGFVGSNLSASHVFDGLYHSTNIADAFGTKPDLLVYSGVRAEKFLANSAPEKDLAAIQEAMQNIRRIQPRKLVLISTIDVYQTPNGVDENSEIDTVGLHPYGKNRYLLEQWTAQEFPDHLIVRLPGLYGINIKKNFIFDMIHIIPSLLNQKKYEELSERSELVRQGYQRQENGFYRCAPLEDDGRQSLREEFLRLGFSALDFTDSRAVYQFYPLRYLWQHIEQALSLGIKKLNLATEGISAGALYQYVRGETFHNELTGTVPHYDYRSLYAGQLGGSDGYLFDKTFLLEDIRKFVLGGNNAQSSQKSL